MKPYHSRLALALSALSLLGWSQAMAQVAVGPKPLYSQTKQPLMPAEYQLTPEEDKKLIRDKCLLDQPAFGDLGNYWSVGATVSTQAVKYTFGTKQASSAASAGVGVAFRWFYFGAPIGTAEAAKKLGFTDQDLDVIKQIKKPDDREHGPFYDDKEKTYSLPIRKVSTACRATTSEIGTDRKDKFAFSLLSITPTIYYSKQAGSDDLSLEPALLIGFFNDLISVGPGFNLSGPEQGKVFLVLSLGYGFKF